MNSDKGSIKRNSNRRWKVIFLLLLIVVNVTFFSWAVYALMQVSNIHGGGSAVSAFGIFVLSLPLNETN
jgi:hypothetical protein